MSAHITNREAVRLMNDNFNESKLLRTMAKGVIEQRNYERLELATDKSSDKDKAVSALPGNWQFWKSPAILMMVIIGLMCLSVSYCGRLAIEKEVKADTINLSLPMKKVIRNLEQE